MTWLYLGSVSSSWSWSCWKIGVTSVRTWCATFETITVKYPLPLGGFCCSVLLLHFSASLLIRVISVDHHDQQCEEYRIVVSVDHHQQQFVEYSCGCLLFLSDSLSLYLYMEANVAYSFVYAQNTNFLTLHTAAAMVFAWTEEAFINLHLPTPPTCCSVFHCLWPPHMFRMWLWLMLSFGHSQWPPQQQSPASCSSRERAAQCMHASTSSSPPTCSQWLSRCPCVSVCGTFLLMVNTVSLPHLGYDGVELATGTKLLSIKKHGYWHPTDQLIWEGRSIPMSSVLLDERTVTDTYVCKKSSRTIENKHAVRLLLLEWIDLPYALKHASE